MEGARCADAGPFAMHSEEYNPDAFRTLGTL